MDATNTLEKVASTILEEPVTIEVDIAPQGWFHLQAQWLLPRFFPKKRTYTLHPVKMGTLIKITKLLLTIPEELIDKKKFLDSSLRAVAGHAETMAMIIALAIHNRKADPPGALVSMIKNQFTPAEVLQTVLIVLRQMNLSSFMSSITLIRSGLSILDNPDADAKSASSQEVSPTVQAETIAPGPLSAV